MNHLDNIRVGETVILVERWRIEEKYVRRMTTNLVWVEGVRQSFRRSDGKDTSWDTPPEYPFIATVTDARMETVECDKRLKLSRVAREYFQSVVSVPFVGVTIKEIRKNRERIDYKIYSREQYIAEISAELEQWKADRLAHSERAVKAEAALRELGFTDDDA
jgi:hypothetical protein